MTVDYSNAKKFFLVGIDPNNTLPILARAPGKDRHVKDYPVSTCVAIIDDTSTFSSVGKSILNVNPLGGSQGGPPGCGIYPANLAVLRAGKPLYITDNDGGGRKFFELREFDDINRSYDHDLVLGTDVLGWINKLINDGRLTSWW